MDIKIINSNKEEIYIPMAGLDISEDNGISMMFIRYWTFTCQV